jgi:cytochrome c-type biogenesis protein CcmE
MINWIRWGLALAALLAAVNAGWQRYQEQVAPIALSAYAQQSAGTQVRLLGRVSGGSLKAEAGALLFVLDIDGQKVPVRYTGKDGDSVRELKTMLVGGKRQADGSLAADFVGINPKYGYVAAGFGLVLCVLLLRTLTLELKLRKLEREAA